LHARTRWTLLFVTMTLLGILSGCGGGGGSSSSQGTPLPAKVLSWEPPTSYVDTTPMNPATDLDRYEIYVNEKGTPTDTDVPMAELRAVDAQTHTLATSFNLANLGPPLTVGPHYYVSLRAVALTGLKSDFSPPAPFSF